MSGITFEKSGPSVPITITESEFTAAWGWTGHAMCRDDYVLNEIGSGRKLSEGLARVILGKEGNYRRMEPYQREYALFRLTYSIKQRLAGQRLSDMTTRGGWISHNVYCHNLHSGFYLPFGPHGRLFPEETDIGILSDVVRHAMAMATDPTQDLNEIDVDPNKKQEVAAKFASGLAEAGKFQAALELVTEKITNPVLSSDAYLKIAMERGKTTKTDEDRSEVLGLLKKAMDKALEAIPSGSDTNDIRHPLIWPVVSGMVRQGFFPEAISYFFRRSCSDSHDCGDLFDKVFSTVGPECADENEHIRFLIGAMEAITRIEPSMPERYKTVISEIYSLELFDKVIEALSHRKTFDLGMFVRTGMQQDWYEMPDRFLKDLCEFAISTSDTAWSDQLFESAIGSVMDNQPYVGVSRLLLVVEHMQNNSRFAAKIGKTLDRALKLARNIDDPGLKVDCLGKIAFTAYSGGAEKKRVAALFREAIAGLSRVDHKRHSEVAITLVGRLMSAWLIKEAAAIRVDGEPYGHDHCLKDIRALDIGELIKNYSRAVPALLDLMETKTEEVNGWNDYWRENYWRPRHEVAGVIAAMALEMRENGDSEGVRYIQKVASQRVARLLLFKNPRPGIDYGIVYILYPIKRAVLADLAAIGDPAVIPTLEASSALNYRSPYNDEYFSVAKQKTSVAGYLRKQAASKEFIDPFVKGFGIDWDGGRYRLGSTQFSPDHSVHFGR